MKQALLQQVKQAWTAIAAADGLDPAAPSGRIQVDRTRDPAHGDFATNAAMVLAKAARCKPRDLATRLVEQLPESGLIARVEIAGPGFINFFLAETAYLSLIPDILGAGPAYGRSDQGSDERVQVEFVSANPTGPLHVGHGRGAAYGAVVANLLEAVGYKVHREYYVNDAGRQMDILATSVWLRYLELCGEELRFPANGYRGDYVWDIAASLHREHGDAYRQEANAVFEGIPEDAPSADELSEAGEPLPAAPCGDKEAHIDALIARAQQLLGDNRYRLVFELGLNSILDDIRDDLAQFGVEYQEWYSERTLAESGVVTKAIERLRAAGHVYEREGALWFRSSDFGDEKDRVLVRENGQSTYFASDIAYHADKLERGFNRVFDIWGADHHGYVPRVKAALQALGDDPGRLDVLLVQFAILYRGGQKVQMSTRSGQFVTLRELRKEVGKDAARFFYIMRRCEQHLDFDLDLAKSQSNDNPVYYVQYAHARIESVLRQAADKGLAIEGTAAMARGVASDPADSGANNAESPGQQGISQLARLTEPHEQSLLRTLSRYPEVVLAAALESEPHQLTHYLRELATDFHAYYNAHQFIVEDADLREARGALILAIRQVLRNGLGLIGVSAPEAM
ncbi:MULTISPECIES: arginine--tRNA ligase [Thiorhodovibrio]|uniref:arginine--tRNA ligase n=1 Tax=Thiorhodovibrio TaxID=61593 RepID=UPI0019144689|nr:MULTISPECIES: arginine--tRNA ligase [Thiorhodovibrio]MBK5969618.1 arginine--tRNA ligase [Thiorhodovibrio winogradskyi]WPL14686.1 Arginine--tRNA ligase [Thiorhodovibrio litoralis]